MRRLRARLTYANVVATLALFVALGGGTYAAGKISGSEIAKRAIKSKHVASGGIKTVDLKGNAVTSPKVANETLTGEDILEESLGRVPTAEEAESAQTAERAAAASNIYWAVIGANGGWLRGDSRIDVDHFSGQTNQGRYHLHFPRDESQCGSVVTPEHNRFPRIAVAEPARSLATGEIRLTVQISDATGSPVNSNFAVIMICPPVG